MPPETPSPLEERIRAIIASEGPIGLDRFMAMALADPDHGYYMTRDPFGLAGDFITAPEISQMFGELLGLWAVEAWLAMGSPDPVLLIELGPGRGTLMADAWRAAGLVPAFREAVHVHLVETSPLLADRQRQLLGTLPAAWHTDIAQVPDGPAIVIANEFFDALPVRQVEARGGRWFERLVGLGPEGRLAFGLSSRPLGDAPLPAAPDGTIREVATAAWTIAAAVARRLARSGGVLLAIDYGFAGPEGAGATVQALRAHRFADPLAHPGEQDITAHVDFRALAAAAQRAGAATQGPVPQGAFLRRLGIEARAGALAAKATSAQQADIAAALARLAGPGPSGMGDLFKVLAIGHPALPILPGFDRRNDPPPPPEPAPPA